jgi:hypothetical protein
MTHLRASWSMWRSLQVGCCLSRRAGCWLVLWSLSVRLCLFDVLAPSAQLEAAARIPTSSL